MDREQRVTLVASAFAEGSMSRQPEIDQLRADLEAAQARIKELETENSRYRYALADMGVGEISDNMLSVEQHWRTFVKRGLSDVLGEP